VSTRIADPVATAQGALIARARRAAGLTQADLATQLGVPMYLVDRMEQGVADSRAHLAGIAHATALPVTALRPRLEKHATAAVLEPDRPIEEEGVVAPGRILVAGSFVVLVLIRFFSEKLTLIPEFTTFVDIPILGILLLSMGIFRPSTATEANHGRQYLGIGIVFFAWAALSLLINLERIAPGPSLLFIYGFLSPLFLYGAFYHLWPAGNARWLTKFFVILVVIQLLIGFFYDFPRFLASGNPDVMSGTFGENGYQLTIFLVVMIGVVVGVATFDRRTLVARFATPLIGGMALLIFLSQFRSLVPFMLVTLGIMTLVVGSGRIRGALVAVVASGIVLFALQTVASQFTILRYDQGLGRLKSDPALFVNARLTMITDLANMYDEDPKRVIFGTGPGTYSSRGWRTFGLAEKTRTDKTSTIAKRINGGTYTSDVAEKYVVPRYRDPGGVIEGSRAATQPFSSFVALAAETGLVGFALLMLAYGKALTQGFRLSLGMVRGRLRDDPVAPLMIGSMVAFLILIQAAVLENWLEVARMTFFAWGLLAISTKELHARDQGRVDA
jgi:transcriptional regulator with XRE-family HTH domain